MASLAQAPPPPPVQNPDAQIVTTEAPDDDARPSTGAINIDSAWTILTSALDHSRRTDTRIQALAALGTLGSSSHAEKLISDAMNDNDLDVRTAAILAAGQTNNRNLTTDLRAKLDDREPQVAFSAATTLWKMGDRSGEDILMAIIESQRSASPSVLHGARHTVSRDLHNPSTLARMGAMQGASMLLGPFGFGITALEYMRKNGGSDTARITAVELIAQENTAPIRHELVSALADKDPGVRAAAAKALGLRHDSTLANDLGTLFQDPKVPVRLTAAAAYINAQTPARAVEPASAPAKKPLRRKH